MPQPGQPGFVKAIISTVETEAGAVVGSFEREERSAPPEGPLVICRADLMLPPNKDGARGIYSLSAAGATAAIAENLFAQQLLAAASISLPAAQEEEGHPGHPIGEAIIHVDFQLYREQVLDQLLSYIQQTVPEVPLPTPGQHAQLQARTMGFDPEGSMPFLLHYLHVASANNLIAAQAELICASLGKITVPGYTEGEERMREDVRKMLIGNTQRIEPLITFLNVALNGLKVPVP